MPKRKWEGWSYRGLSQQYGLELCTDDKTCDRGVSLIKHRAGYTDNFGRIHWQHKYPRKSGIRRFLTLVAWARLNHHSSKKPVWMQIYERDRWAYHEGIDGLHMRFPRRFSDPDRKLARKNVHYLEAVLRRPQNLRRGHEVIYRWLINTTED